MARTELWDLPGPSGEWLQKGDEKRARWIIGEAILPGGPEPEPAREEQQEHAAAD